MTPKTGAFELRTLGSGEVHINAAEVPLIAISGKRDANPRIKCVDSGIMIGRDPYGGCILYATAPCFPFSGSIRLFNDSQWLCNNTCPHSRIWGSRKHSSIDTGCIHLGICSDWSSSSSTMMRYVKAVPSRSQTISGSSKHDCLEQEVCPRLAEMPLSPIDRSSLRITTRRYDEGTGERLIPVPSVHRKRRCISNKENIENQWRK